MVEESKTEVKEQKTCQARRHDDSLCGRPLYDKHYCIFHSRDLEGKKNNFNKSFENEFEKQKEKEIFDFTGFIFPDSILFRGKKFHKNTYFKRAEFHENATSFRAAEFTNDLVDFSDAKFVGKSVDFSDTQFLSKKTDFYGTKFYGENTYFSNASFRSERIEFVAVEFSSTVCTGFNGAKFDGITLFNASSFNNKNVSFCGTEFSGKLTAFDRAFFFEKVDFQDSFFKNVEGLFEILIGKPEFLKWKKVLPKTLKYELSILKKIKILIEIIKYKLNFLRKMEYRVKDFRFRLGEESATRYPVIMRLTQDAWYLADFKRLHPFIYKRWKQTSNCGRNILLWAAWSLGIALLFAFIFMIIGSDAFELRHNKTWFSWFYYSIVTFTTLGFGDITPTKWCTEILVTLEVILGYIMLGGLISIFANKLARRS